MKIALNTGIGLAGCGKGTNAPLLDAAFGKKLYTIGTGELCRAEIAAKTPLGIKIEPIYNAGGLIDDEDIMTMVIQNMQPTDTNLDGVVRKISQAREMGKVVNGFSEEFRLEIQQLIYYYDIPSALARERMLDRKRDGETAAVIEKRLNIALKNNDQILEYYYKLGTPILTLDATKDIVGNLINRNERIKKIGGYIAGHGFGPNAYRIR